MQIFSKVKILKFGPKNTLFVIYGLEFENTYLLTIVILNTYGTITIFEIRALEFP